MKLWIGFLGISLLGQTLTLEKERALGAGLAAEFRRQARPLAVPKADEYVERLGVRLGAESRPEVVRADEPEPIGLLGGTLFIPAKFFLAVENEAEFAGMIAHAIGHIVLRHGFIETKGSIPLVFLGGMLGAHTRSLLVPSSFRPKLARFEIEADVYGAELLARAGFPPAALQHYLRRVAPDRAANLEEIVGRSSEPFVSDGSEFPRVRELVRAALQVPVRRAPSLRR